METTEMNPKSLELLKQGGVVMMSFASLAMASIKIYKMIKSGETTEEPTE